MTLEKEEKTQVIGEFRAHEKDVGSPQVQIALLTQRIEELSKHVQAAPKDLHSKRGLIAMIEKRRRLLRYLKRVNPEIYTDILKKLSLRK
jgi:small subunit ribosomal protein S15